MKKEEMGDNNFGLASSILGILSVVLSLSGAQLSPGAIALGIIGLIFSSKQNKSCKNRWSRNGKVLSIIGIALGIIMFVIFIYTFSTFTSTLSQYGT